MMICAWSMLFFSFWAYNITKYNIISVVVVDEQQNYYPIGSKLIILLCTNNIIRLREGQRAKVKKKKRKIKAFTRIYHSKLKWNDDKIEWKNFFEVKLSDWSKKFIRILAIKCLNTSIKLSIDFAIYSIHSLQIIAFSAYFIWNSTICRYLFLVIFSMNAYSLLSYT